MPISTPYIRIIILISSLLLLLTACKSEPEHPAGVPVTVKQAIPADTPVSFEFVGKTESSRRVEIRARVSGFLEKRLYAEGSMVEAEQILFQMDQKPFQATLQAAEAQLTQQQANFANTKANLERVKPLAEQNAVSKKDLDDAENAYRSAKAAVEAAAANVTQAKLDLSYTSIRSPVTGLSSFAKQQEGAYINSASQDNLLTYVAQMSPMRVEFSISENQILKLRDQAAKGLLLLPENNAYTVEIKLANDRIYPHTGVITFRDAALNEATGTFLVRAEVANPDHELRPGMFVRIQINGAVRPNAIKIPQRAIQQSAQGSYVWVVDSAGKAERRPVTLGSWYQDEWFVSDGLQGNEMVVIDGGLKLRAGMPVTITENGTPPAKTSAQR